MNHLNNHIYPNKVSTKRSPVPWRHQVRGVVGVNKAF